MKRKDSFDVIKNMRNSEDIEPIENNETENLQNNSRITTTKNNKKLSITDFIIKFLIINILIFVIVICKQSIGRPYPVAKVNMAIAVTIHYLYEIPLSKVFGPYNVLTKPVYVIRDYFYNNGLVHLPKNDAERYIWWSRIRFDEWYNCVMPELLDYIGKRIDENKVDKNKHLKWTDEIYSNLIPLGELPLKDEVFKEVRFKTYNDVAWFYARAKSNLVYRMYYPLNSKNFPYNDPYINNKMEIDKVKKIFKDYSKLKNYVKENEKEGFAKLLKGKDSYMDSMVELYYISEILGYDIVNNQLTCNNYLIQIYLKNKHIVEQKISQDAKISNYEKHRTLKILKSNYHKFILEELNYKCRINK